MSKNTEMSKNDVPTPPGDGLAEAKSYQRFDLAERIVHWLVALSFVYAALTGLALWSPRLYWLATIFGGGETVRGWHPWGGVMFALVLGVMFRKWAGQMRLDGADLRWLRNAHRYATHDDTGLPESDRFNAGQKLLFWLQGVSAFVLLASGIVLWFPESMSQGLRLAAILIHPVVAMISLGAIIVHIYMGTVGVPGSFRSMVRGWVKPGWAATHHAKWYRRISRR